MDNSFKQQKLEEVEQDLIQLSTETFKHCMSLWSQIGYSKQEIINRCNEIFVHFNQVYDDLIYTESMVLKDIQSKLESYRQTVKNLQKKLNVQLDKFNDSNNNSNERGLDSVDFRSNSDNLLKKKTMLEEMDFYKNMIKELSQIKLMRKDKFTSLKKKEKVLCDILNRTEHSISDSSYIDQSEIDFLEGKVKDLSFEKNSRIDQLKVFCSEISHLITEYKLRVDPNSSLYNLVELNELDSDQLKKKIVAEKISLHPSQMDKYRSSLGKLNIKKEQLINSINLLRADILNIWSKFDLKNSDLEDLILNSVSYNQETYNILFEEYNRCCKFKQDRIKFLVNEKYNEIANLTNFCLIDQNVKIELERKTFENGYTEDVLEEHQKHLKNIRDYALKYENFFNSLKEWTDLWQQFKEFEKAHMDPKRFHQRGYSSLAEQRERDSFKTKLNKLRQQLDAEANRYASGEGHDLLIQGQSLADFMENLKKEFEKEKENMREARRFGTSSLRKKSVVRNFLTPQNQHIRSSSIQKSLLMTQSPSPSATRHFSAKLSSRNSAKVTTNSIRMGLNFDSTPYASRINKSTPKKFLDNVNSNDKKKSTLVQLNQKNKRRSSIKDLSEKYKRHQRRSKVLFEEKFLNEGALVSKHVENILENGNDSILKFSNFSNGESIHCTSSGVMSGISSSSGISQGIHA